MSSPNRTAVPFSMFVKAIGLIASGPLLVVAALVFLGDLNVSHAMLAAISVLAISGIMIRPYLANVAALTQYVDDLAQDRRVEEPDLSFLGNIGPLSESVRRLHRSWERKKQQMESMLSEREILVDTIPDLLIMIDSEGNIIRSNSSARQRFGQNLALRRLSQVIDNNVLQDAVQDVMKDFRGKDVEFYLPEPLDCYFRAKIERFPVYSKGGIAAILTLHDITELKRIEQMRADFVANASHEIRTPLASLIGFIETLQGPAKDDEGARDQFLKIMAEQAGRMSKLVNDLLSLSKIEMNVSSEPVGKISVNKLLDNVQRNTEWQANQRNVVVEVKAEGEVPNAKGDEGEITQVIQNLVENAIKYGFSDSTVRVAARVTTDIPKDRGMGNITRAVAIAVTDRGEGIAKEHIPRLTERFYRVDTARSRKIGGTGLGLAIVKHIINRHRGALVIESEVGQGSTFTVFLPVHEG